MLAYRQVEALDKRRVALPTARRQHLLDGFQGATHDAVLHADQTAAPHGLAHLRREQPGEGHPARFRRRAVGPPARRLDPLALVRQQRRRVRLEAIGEEEGHTTGRQHLDDLMDHTLRHGQRAVADIDGQEHLGDRIDRRPYPMG